MNTVGESPHPELLGAYVMGVLDPQEHAGIESHLATCQTCRRELDQLSRIHESLTDVPGALVLDELEHVDDILVEGGDPADDLLLQRSLRKVRSTSTRSTRTRWLGVAATVVAIAGLAGWGGAAIGGTTAPEPEPLPQAVGPVYRGTDAVTGVSLTAEVTPAEGWSRLAVSIGGAPVGDKCRLVAIGADGTREIAGSWIIGKPVPGKPPPTVDTAAAIAVPDLAQLELLTGTGRHLVTIDV